MTEKTEGKRAQLIRESLVFQVKLIADGMRDFLLVPVSIAATIVGLIRSNENPEEEFNRVIDLGRKTEQWINLFGQHDPIQEAGDAGSIDRLVTRAEEVVREQVRSGEVSQSASSAIERALDSLHRKVREDKEEPGQ